MIALNWTGKVDSWWRWVLWHCSYCVCKCDELTDDSDRFWSLAPAVADTAANKVWPAPALPSTALRCRW